MASSIPEGVLNSGAEAVQAASAGCCQCSAAQTLMYSLLCLAVFVFFHRLYTSRKAWIKLQADLQKKGVSKRVCVVGCGTSGLTTIKGLVEQGHTVVCYEKEADFGGVWNKTVKSTKMYSCLLSTSSTYLTSFSDFPVPADSSYKHQWHFSSETYMDYLMNYAKRFDIMKHVEFNAQVSRIVHLNDGGYKVTTTTGGDEATAKTETFDAIAVCSGLHQVPSIPKTEGMDIFKGRIVHSSEFKGHEEFAGKTVTVLGCGESGADILKSLSDVCPRTTLSLRRGIWVLPRIIHSYPNDYFTTRAFYAIPLFIRVHLGRWWFYSWHLYGFWRTALNLLPPEGVALQKLAKLSGGSMFNSFATKSEVFVPNLIAGKINLKPNIARLTEDSVVYADGTEEKTDVVMYCTGYRYSFPFLENEPTDGRTMYKVMFEPETPDIAFIGCLRPGLGAIPPCAELQARFYSMLLAEKISLPSEEKMRMTAACDGATHRSVLFHVTERMHYLIDFTFYLNTLAGFIGARPNFYKLMTTNPVGWYKVVFGPYTAHQFRIHGPNASEDGARAALNAPVMPTYEIYAFYLASTLCTVLSYLPGLGFLTPRLDLA